MQPNSSRTAGKSFTSRSPTGPSGAKAKAAPRYSGQAKKEPLVPKSVALHEAKKDGKLVKQGLMSARSYLKPQPLAHHGASVAGRAKAQAESGPNHFNSFAGAQERRPVAAAGKTTASSLPGSLINKSTRDPVAYLKDPSEKKKR